MPETEFVRVPKEFFTDLDKLIAWLNRKMGDAQYRYQKEIAKEHRDLMERLLIKHKLKK